MNVMCLSRRWLLIAALFMCNEGAFAGEVFVISNGVATMTAEELKEVFLGESQFAGTLKLQPVDNAGAQAEFLARVLNMAAQKYVSVWRKKAFLEGLNAPPMKATDAEVVNFVKTHGGAIGYVTTPPQGVHVVGKF